MKHWCGMGRERGALVGEMSDACYADLTSLQTEHRLCAQLC